MSIRIITLVINTSASFSLETTYIIPPRVGKNKGKLEREAAPLSGLDVGGGFG
jgi:hypothetical protein